MAWEAQEDKATAGEGQGRAGRRTGSQCVMPSIRKASLGQADRHCGPIIATRRFSQLLLVSFIQLCSVMDG